MFGIHNKSHQHSLRLILSIQKELLCYDIKLNWYNSVDNTEMRGRYSKNTLK